MFTKPIQQLSCCYKLEANKAKMGKEILQYFVVDAFTETAFKGNPAAVCLLEEEKDDQWLQSVAAEFNTPATGFLTRLSDGVSSNPRFCIRFFTPVTEVPLCGHATLAVSHTVFTNGFLDSDLVEFVTKSGVLTARKVHETEKNDGASGAGNGRAKLQPESFLIELDFPAVLTTELDNSVDPALHKAIGSISIMDIRMTALDLFVVVPSAEAVTELQPNFDEILKYPARAIIVTGAAQPESGYDFYTRVFSPKLGINEDHVTGSVHCGLATYWSDKLGRCDFKAYQASPRSGVLNIHLDKKNQRVLLRGKAVAVMKGCILV